jgi:hypothetical protein
VEDKPVLVIVYGFEAAARNRVSTTTVSSDRLKFAARQRLMPPPNGIHAWAGGLEPLRRNPISTLNPARPRTEGAYAFRGLGPSRNSRRVSSGGRDGSHGSGAQGHGKSLVACKGYRSPGDVSPEAVA